MKIAIVNDVVVIAEALRRAVVNMPEHQVAWVANSGAEAVQRCAEDRPDLILMDLIMPEMDGVETIRLIMQSSPCAILIVTASPDQNTSLVFRAMGAGALDVVATPIVQGEFASISALHAKIKTIGKLIRIDRNDKIVAARMSGPNQLADSTTQAELLIAIGASTGGPAALSKILANIAPLDSVAIVIVQHIDASFADTLAQWLGEQVLFPVRTIKEGSLVSPGCIHLAKSNDHVLLDKSSRFRYAAEPLDYPYRPSVDVFFESVAANWKGSAMGVLLTGMGCDGAKGLLTLRQAGQLTIAQDQASSVVYGMPRAAAELGAAKSILSLDAIASVLKSKLESLVQ